MLINRERFVTELARNCFSMKELATKSSVNIVTLSRVKQGTQNPSPATVGKIAKALGVTVEELTSKEDNHGI